MIEDPYHTPPPLQAPPLQGADQKGADQIRDVQLVRTILSPESSVQMTNQVAQKQLTSLAVNTRVRWASAHYPKEEVNIDDKQSLTEIQTIKNQFIESYPLIRSELREEYEAYQRGAEVLKKLEEQRANGILNKEDEVYQRGAGVLRKLEEQRENGILNEDEAYERGAGVLRELEKQRENGILNAEDEYQRGSEVLRELEKEHKRDEFSGETPYSLVPTSPQEVERFKELQRKETERAQRLERKKAEHHENVNQAQKIKNLISDKISIFKKEAKQTGEIHYYNKVDEDQVVIVKPSKKVYIKVEKLGKGQDLTKEPTLQVMKVSSTWWERFLHKPPVFKAYTSMSYVEAARHQYIKNTAKEQGFNISNLSVATSVAAVTNKETEAVMYGVLTPVCNGGDVNRLLQEGVLNPQEKIFVIVEAIKGIEQLHRLNIAHSDLNPGNLLVERNEQNQIVKAKISDFGLSNPLNRGEASEKLEPIDNFRFPRNLVAPECLKQVDGKWMIISNNIRSEKGDIYQLGMLIYSILFDIPFSELRTIRGEDISKIDPNNKEEFKDLSEEIIFWKEHVDEWPRLNNANIDKKTGEMLKRILAKDPEKRPSLKEIKEFFSNQLEKPQPKPTLLHKVKGLLKK